MKGGAKFEPSAVDVPRLLAELEMEAERRGDTWVAKCPSGRHEDRKPSWEILDRPGDPKNGLHTCRSCHWGGGSVDLVRQAFGFAGSSEAVRWIVERAMGTPGTLEKLTISRRPTIAALELPADGIYLPLSMWATTPRRYVESRGITAEQVVRWGLGYAVAGSSRGRIIFPARDADGRLLNYTARTFCGALVRYRSAEEREGPDPAAIFGEVHWPRIDARSTRTVSITEGAINALAVERAMRTPGGEAPPVASLFGSNVQLEQVVKLSTFGRAVVLTDPDPAGDAAAERIWGALVRHVEVLRVRLPAGEDAASVSEEALREAICRSLT